MVTMKLKKKNSNNTNNKKDSNSKVLNHNINEPYVFSKKSEKRMKRYFKRKRRECNPIYRFVKNLVYMIAAVAIGIITIFGEKTEAVLFVTPPFVVESFDNFVKLRYGDKIQYSEYKPKKIEEFEELSYLPDGYMEISRNDKNMSNEIIYSNGENIILYKKNIVKTYLDINKKMSEYSVLKEDHIDIYYTIDKGQAIITWYQEGFEYIISGGVSLDELLKIKKGINFK